MPRPVSIFLLTLILFGMMHVSCQVRAQSPKEITNSIGMKMVLIPKGTFDMGSAATDRGADLDEPQHQVTLSRAPQAPCTELHVLTGPSTAIGGSMICTVTRGNGSLIGMRFIPVRM